MEESRKTYFITGATGFIGSHLALRLARDGHTVHALVRSPGKTKYIEHPDIKYHYGDLFDREVIRGALEGCDGVFHLAAFAKPWAKDPALPYKLNVEATARLLEEARSQGVKRFVFTSSAATLAISGHGPPADEETPRESEYLNQYDRTKAEAEKVVISANGNGTESVIVNPTRVYGPGLLSVSNGIGRIMKRYLEGKWRIIPGNGESIGNYVYVDDVVNGHIGALKKGRKGERYILGGENISFDELFDTIGEVAGKKYRLFHLPAPLMNTAAHAAFYGARLFNAPPPITPSWMKKYLYHSRFSSRKAATELGYTITSFKEGTTKTMEWIRKNKLS